MSEGKRIMRKVVQYFEANFIRGRITSYRVKLECGHEKFAKNNRNRRPVKSSCNECAKAKEGT